MIAATPPAPDEYAASFADYVGRVGREEDVMVAMARQLDELQSLVGRVPEARGDYRYAPEKWSVKDVIGHLTDTERVFGYRALRIGRGDTTPLPSFDDQSYVAAVRAGERTLADLVAEWADVRRATLALFRHLPAEAWKRRGTAGGNPASVRAIAYVVVGHVRHHLEVLEARYAAALAGR